jgi:XTP/dITP diphosphohydrolase
MIQLVLATRNRKKLRELQQILEGLPIELRTVEEFPGVPEVEESGTTFEENAVLKARAVAAATGHWSLADDSGLEVDALGGRPGVYSARYAGPDATDERNRRRLLEALEGVPLPARTARFVAVVALSSPEGEVICRRGECEGRIILEERGTGGFGYDPIFLIDALNQTMAELAPEVKHGLSHRGKALAALREELERPGPAGQTVE